MRQTSGIIAVVLASCLAITMASALIDDSSDAYVGEGYTIYLEPGQYFDDIPVLGTDFFINTVEPVDEPSWITDSEYCETDDKHVNNGYRVSGTAPSEPGVYNAVYHVKDVWGNYEDDLTVTFVVGDVDYVEPEPEVPQQPSGEPQDVPTESDQEQGSEVVQPSVDDHIDTGDRNPMIAVGAVVGGLVVVIASYLFVNRGGA